MQRRSFRHGTESISNKNSFRECDSIVSDPSIVCLDGGDVDAGCSAYHQPVEYDHGKCTSCRQRRDRADHVCGRHSVGARRKCLIDAWHCDKRVYCVEQHKGKSWRRRRFAEIRCGCRHHAIFFRRGSSGYFARVVHRNRCSSSCTDHWGMHPRCFRNARSIRRDAVAASDGDSAAAGGSNEQPRGSLGLGCFREPCRGPDNNWNGVYFVDGAVRVQRCGPSGSLSEPAWIRRWAPSRTVQSRGCHHGARRVRVVDAPCRRSDASPAAMATPCRGVGAAAVSELDDGGRRGLPPRPGDGQCFADPRTRGRRRRSAWCRWPACVCCHDTLCCICDHHDDEALVCYEAKFSVSSSRMGAPRPWPGTAAAAEHVGPALGGCVWYQLEAAKFVAHQ